jgi:hypothetical protein
MPRHLHFIARLVVGLALLGLAPLEANAAAKKVLFVTINGSYNGDGDNMFSELQSYVASQHGNAALAEKVILSQDGQVAALLAQHTYEQIWVYDLSYLSTDPYPTDYVAIANWYNQAPVKEIICDGRFLSSFWNGRSSGEGRKVTQNYYYNLMVRGGGLVLATDHDEFFNFGMNNLNAALGLNPFVGNFPNQAFPLDEGHPLTTEPHILTGLFNDSSTGQAPFGVQPNGRTLRTIGYHSGVATSPGISTTIDGGVLGITVDIAESGGVLCQGTRTFNASITSGSQFGPFTYEWRVNNVVVGTGTSYTFDADTRVAGTYEVKVIAQGAGARADDDTAIMTVGGAACGCGFDAESICSEGGGAVIAIALEGPLADQYVVCRLVPAGYGTPPVATGNELRCTDADNDGVLDLFDGETLVTQFANGFCGYTSTIGAF